MSDNAALAEILGTGSKGKSSFDVKAILNIARRFYWIILLFVVAATAVGLAYLKTTTYVYRSTAKMRIERRPVIVTTSGVVGDSGISSEMDLNTLEKSFLSRDLFQKVAGQLSPAEREELMGGVSSEPVEIGAVAWRVAKDSSVALIEDTRLMEVSFDNPDPALATKVTNLLLDQGIQLDTDQRVNAVDSNIRFLQNESEKLEAKLKTAEEKLNSYIKGLGTVSIDDNFNIVAEQFRAMHQRYVTAKAERLSLEADFQDVKEAKGDPSKLLIIQSVQKVPAVAQLLTKKAQIRDAIVNLNRRYRPENPRLEQLGAQLKDVDQDLHRELLLAPGSIESAIEIARRNEESLSTESAAQEKEVIQIKEASVESKVLQRQIDADKLAYETILRRLNEELSQIRAQPVIIQVVERAEGAYQVKPKPVQVIMIAVFAGAMLGAGVIVLILQLDSSIRSVEDAEQALGVPVLAVVPKSDDKPAEVSTKSNVTVPMETWKMLPVFVDKYSTSAEAFRTLNASIQMLEVSENQNFTLITSSLPGEGKSYVCLNAATAIALSGRRTLLVDADLRKPVIESRFFGSRNLPGLAEYLSGRLSMDEIIRPSGLRNLDIIPAGKAEADPTELLSRQRFEAFLDEAKREYDQVIFDSAPVSAVSDTLCFARFFNVVCVVARAGKTPRNSAKRTLEMLRRAGATPSGVIINYVTKEFRSGYYGYYNYYNQYYGHKTPAEASA